MAAMSIAPGATTTTTISPTSSTHEDQSGWKLSSSYRTDSMNDHQLLDNDINGSAEGSLYPHNGHFEHDPYDAEEYPSTKENHDSGRSASNPEKKRGDKAMTKEEEDKWIHRDKLALIENEELQAAGIVLPKPRAHSRPRRERSPEKNGYTRSRKNSTLSIQTTESEAPIPAWDLRLPQEIAEDPEDSQRRYWISGGSTKGSRIPVAKLSPAPIPPDYLERDAPISRKASGNPLDDDASIAMPRPARSRSNSGAKTLDETLKNPPAKRSAPEASPRKTVQGTRKPPTTREKQSAAGRSKARSTSKTRNGSASRPTTRSGETMLSSKAPEGEPPWLVSAYKPDPRLPPDQQLLPTVAKRLQQEKWEQEGKFGNIYDKEFRPLNDDAFTKPPDSETPKKGEEQQDEWPLRVEAKSPSSPRPGTSSYSTMPRIQDRTSKSSYLSGPRQPQQGQMQPTQPVIRVPDPDTATDADGNALEQGDEKAKGGCGCCVVM